MRFSRAFIPTTKEAPKEATLPSHIYLMRGGFVTQVAAGIYDFLPLGKKVLDKISAIVKDELNKAGCIEVSLGFVTPCEMWQKSHRFEKYGKELLRFKDRKENCFVLGPTHEEMMVELVKNRVTSYKQLPLNLYQINLKFRDEARPRFGLMRGREFLMKDGYSFHASTEDMKREFDLMEMTYKKIFERLGLQFRVVEADSGAIGGSGSKEFMVLANSGEDTIVVCDRCEYAANVEAAKRQPRTSLVVAPQGIMTQVSTPGVKTIEEVSRFLGVDPFFTIKAVAKRAMYDEGSQIVLFFVRGDDELEETKALNAVNANDLIDVNEDELASVGLCAGFIGLDNCPEGITFVIDHELKGAVGMVTGSNRADTHTIHFSVQGYDENRFDDLITVQAGDTCGCCGGTLGHTKGIEVGHIFQLGTRYSEPLEAKFLDANGKSAPFVMGTYGIGVSRLLAAIIEQRHDERGCIWTQSVAPYDIMIVLSNVKDEAQKEYATTLYDRLVTEGYDVLFDDRDERFGVKMADFELIGIPKAVVVGKNLANGSVEVVTREGVVKQTVDKDELYSYLTQSQS